MIKHIVLKNYTLTTLMLDDIIKPEMWRKRRLETKDHVVGNVKSKENLEIRFVRLTKLCYKTVINCPDW